MTIEQYIIFLINENFNVCKIKITDYFNFNQNNFNINLNNNQQTNIIVEKHQSNDIDVIEFYNNNNELIAKAKGFSSVL